MRGTLIDSNIWLAIALDRHRDHTAAQKMIHDISPDSPAYFCRATEQSILRLLTTAAIQSLYEAPEITNESACQLLNEWQAEPNISCIDEPDGTRTLWLHLAKRNTASPKLWMDAYLAAFAITAKLHFTTNDKAFSQFEPQGLELKFLHG